MKRKSTYQEQEVFEYLNELRESGATNMFGATRYIVKEFRYSEDESRRMLSLWMANFNQEGNYSEIEDKNLSNETTS